MFVKYEGGGGRIVLVGWRSAETDSMIYINTEDKKLKILSELCPATNGLRYAPYINTSLSPSIL
jgi:hypothetical protein